MVFQMVICRYRRKDFDAFLDGRLAPRARRRIARHIDTCSSCYEFYVQRRDLQRELQQDLPLVGRGHEPDFERLWGVIRAELPRPEPLRTQFRYGLVVLLALLALLVPFTMGNHELALAVPFPAVPQTNLSTETPSSTDEPEHVATVAASSATTSSLARGFAPPTLPEPHLGR